MNLNRRFLERDLYGFLKSEMAGKRRDEEDRRDEFCGFRGDELG